MSMKLLELEEGKQQYALKCTDTQTGQSFLVSYNASSILTTDHEELVNYACRLVRWFGKSKIYTICMVAEVECKAMEETYAEINTPTESVLTL